MLIERIEATAVDIIQRTNYSIGGQMVGVRVVKLDANDNELPNEPGVGLFYTYTDHLGNVSALSDINGNYVTDSLGLHRPFGSYRVEPTTNPDITDRGFTGHKENLNLGLTYMNARYYVGDIGRFASADTIVPDPMNPQAFNRYTYVLNNPLKLIDPTGHNGCIFGYLSCTTAPTTPYQTYSDPDPRQIPSAHGVGVAYSAETPSFIGSWEVNIAFEIVWDDDEVVFFVAPGQDVSRGISSSGVELLDTGDVSKIMNRTIYVAQIFNTENLADDYAEQFDINSFTASAGHGFTIADAFTPGDENTAPINRTEAYSLIFGYTPGIAFTHNEGSSYYIPIVSPGEQYPSYPANHYLPENQAPSYTYPYIDD